MLLVQRSTRPSGTHNPHMSTASTAKTHWTTSKTTGTLGKQARRRGGNRGWEGTGINNAASKIHLQAGEMVQWQVLTHENPSSDS